MSDSQRVEWRVSWTMWPFALPEPHRSERVTEDEAGAREQYAGLQSMLAEHEPRPCDRHVWEPKLERRVVREDAWEDLSVSASE